MRFPYLFALKVCAAGDARETSSSRSGPLMCQKSEMATAPAPSAVISCGPSMVSRPTAVHSSWPRPRSLRARTTGWPPPVPASAQLHRRTSPRRPPEAILGVDDVVVLALCSTHLTSHYTRRHGEKGRKKAQYPVECRRPRTMYIVRRWRGREPLGKP